jgi:formiminotetrahydrofolate cyclodeaminase
MTLSTFSSEVASEKPVPGGGSVAAYVACLAASLVSMVARLTLKKNDLQKHWPTVNEVLAESDKLRATLLAQVDKDSKSFDALMRAYRLPKETEDDKKARSMSIQASLKEATEVPLQTAEQAALALSAGKRLAEYANVNAISDLETAVAAAFAGFAGSVANIRINLSGVNDVGYRKRIQERLTALQRQVEKDQKDADSILAARAKT